MSFSFPFCVLLLILAPSFVQLLCNCFVLLRPQSSLGAQSFVSLRQGHVSKRCRGEALGPGGTLGQRGVFKYGCRSAVIFLQSEVKWKAVFDLTLYMSFLSHCVIWLYVEYASTFVHIELTAGSRRAAWPHSADVLPPLAPITPGVCIVMLEQGIIFNREGRPMALNVW